MIVKYKVPQESDDYSENSKFVVERISQIMEMAIKTGLSNFLCKLKIDPHYD